ncbi:MAG: NifU N-terminal domain-containing protein [Bacteroidetes bacterium]|nr:NifU N-terminal domain-containing protein [Bacteroidota bacterium]
MSTRVGSGKELPFWPCSLLGFYISGVFITTNFVTLTKNSDVDWYETMGIFREFIKRYLKPDNLVFIGPVEQIADPKSTGQKLPLQLKPRSLKTSTNMLNLSNKTAVRFVSNLFQMV